jgi:hypothetical protein
VLAHQHDAVFTSSEYGWQTAHGYPLLPCVVPFVTFGDVERTLEILESRKNYQYVKPNIKRAGETRPLQPDDNRFAGQMSRCPSGFSLRNRARRQGATPAVAGASSPTVPP